MNQKELAKKHFTSWLMEQGVAPVFVDVVNQFVRNELNYYVIEYQFAGSELLIGVAGGYEEGSSEHSGHINSKMQLLEEGNEIAQAEELVNAVETYWSTHASSVEKIASKHAEEGVFAGHVLLANYEWDFDSLQLELAERWNIKTEAEETEHKLSFEVDDMSVVLSLHEGMVPHHEAEINASSNINWPEVQEIVKYHQAYLEVSVISGSSRLEAGKLHVKLLSCASMQDNVLAISVSGTVFEPGYYDECSDLMKEGQLPIYNLIHFGFYRTTSGLSGYTYGMKFLGHREIELLDTFAEIEDLHEFMATVVHSVLMNQIELKDGNKISVAEGHELLVSESMSETLGEITVKIEYPN